MRINATTRVSFQYDKLTLNLPEGWHELSQRELLRVYICIGVFDVDRLSLGVFSSITGIRIIREVSDSEFLCYYSADKRKFIISSMQMSDVLDSLSWLFTPGNVPVRLDEMNGVKAVDASLHGVRFSDYLALENSYQGYLHSKQERALRGAAAILYPGMDVSSPLSELNVLNILQWCVQIKNMFAGIFVNLFKSDGTGGDVSPLEVMNNQIRALTGGDVTKEDTVFNTDCWRALTELDFKAMEAEDFKASLPKK